MISYAQNLEDVVINRVFQNKRNGFYIDVGAHNPVELSVTKYFYDLGWHGINIEPIYSSFSKFLDERPRDINLNIGISNKVDRSIIYYIDGSPEGASFNKDIVMQSLNKKKGRIIEKLVEIKTLKDVCEEHVENNIDFIKIDVEGWEKQVLEGADWIKYKPTFLIIEATKPYEAYIKDWDNPDVSGTWKEWEYILLNAGYESVYFDGMNKYYLANEKRDFRKYLSIPINPIQDQYICYSEKRQERLLQIKTTELQDIKKENEKLKKDNKNYVIKNHAIIEDNNFYRNNITELIRQSDIKNKSLKNVIRRYKIISEELQNRTGIHVNNNDLDELINYSLTLKIDKRTIVNKNENSNNKTNGNISKHDDYKSVPSWLTEVLPIEDAEILISRNQKPIYASLKSSSYCWNISQYNSSSEKYIVQLDWVYQNNYALKFISDSEQFKKYHIIENSDIYRKVNFKEEKFIKNSNYSLMSMYKYEDRDLTNDIKLLVKVLKSSVLFAHYYYLIDSYLLDFAIDTHTPLLINAIPSVVEILGCEYPLYYYSYIDALEKVKNNKLVEETSKYLISLSKEKAYNSAVFELNGGKIFSITYQKKKDKEPGKIDLGKQADYYYGKHRSGWSYVVTNIKESLHKEGAVYLDTFIERTMIWGQKAPQLIDRDWIGIVHNPPYIPDFFQSITNNCNFGTLLKSNKILMASMYKCKGLIALSEHHRTYLEELVDVPVISLLHPIEKADKQWNFEAVLKNKKIKVVQIGWWLRNLHGIFMLKTNNDKINKIYLSKNEDQIEKCFIEEEKILRKKGIWKDKMRKTCTEMDFISNKDYDTLLSESVVFLDLYDSSANNAVIECIIRNTPVLVNKNPAVIEYLGERYPFYFNDYNEASEKIHDIDIIKEAHDYLKSMNKEKVDINYFCNEISKFSRAIDN